MQLVQSYLLQLPIVVACAVFVIAAMFKVGKEKGAGLIAGGAIGLVGLVIIDPLVNIMVMPAIIEGLSPAQISFAFLIRSGISNVSWAAAIALVAMGTFSRSPAVEGK